MVGRRHVDQPGGSRCANSNHRAYLVGSSLELQSGNIGDSVGDLDIKALPGVQPLMKAKANKTISVQHQFLA